MIDNRRISVSKIGNKILWFYLIYISEKAEIKKSEIKMEYTSSKIKNLNVSNKNEPRLTNKKRLKLWQGPSQPIGKCFISGFSWHRKYGVLAS